MIKNDIESLRHYLKNCVEDWVEHELLRMHFSEEIIWVGLHKELLIPMEEFHCYSINI